MSFCSLTKGIALKICRLRVCVLINKRSFEPSRACIFYLPEVKLSRVPSASMTYIIVSGLVGEGPMCVMNPFPAGAHSSRLSRPQATFTLNLRDTHTRDLS